MQAQAKKSSASALDALIEATIRDPEVHTMVSVLIGMISGASKIGIFLSLDAARATHAEQTDYVLEGIRALLSSLAVPSKLPRLAETGISPQIIYPLEKMRLRMPLQETAELYFLTILTARETRINAACCLQKILTTFILFSHGWTKTYKTRLAETDERAELADVIWISPRSKTEYSGWSVTIVRQG